MTECGESSTQRLLGWSIGVVEYWSSGPETHYSTTPLLHHSRRRLRSFFICVCLILILPVPSPEDLGRSRLTHDLLLQPAIAGELLHPKYKLPAHCFAYVGDASNTTTWKLPYLLPNGDPDLKRLPAAIQAVTTGYRGKMVTGIPDSRIPDVLVTLGRAAAKAGKLPVQDQNTAGVYRELEVRLRRLGRFGEIPAAQVNQ